MKLGIDFDNTIINYEPLFQRLIQERGWLSDLQPISRHHIKELLVAQDGHDQRWQELQAEAYGRRILEAKPHEGFLEFAALCAKSNCSIAIVSHKSETSHFDPTVYLRDAAQKWLQNYVQKNASYSIYFESTIRSKINRINLLLCHFFIDDLAQVLQEDSFPKATQKIWFNPENRTIDLGADVLEQNSWQQIHRLFEYMFLKRTQPIRFFRQKQSGNNQIYQIQEPGSQPTLLKRYFQRGPETPNGCEREFNALALLRAHDVVHVPIPIWREESGYNAVYSWEAGRRPNPEDIGSSHIDAAVAFLKQVIQIGKTQQNNEQIKTGIGARFSLADHYNTVAGRFQKLLEGYRDFDSGVVDFIDHTITPLVDGALYAFKCFMEKAPERERLPLARSESVLSPEDFNFHNTLINGDETITFLDFEYFGWDDPAKLMADWLYSAAFDVSPTLRWRLFENVVSGLPGLDRFRFRWNAVRELIAVEWILIVLNVLDRRVRARKLFSNSSEDAATLASRQILKAKKQIDFIDTLRSNAPTL